MTSAADRTGHPLDESPVGQVGPVGSVGPGGQVGIAASRLAEAKR